MPWIQLDEKIDQVKTKELLRKSFWIYFRKKYSTFLETKKLFVLTAFQAVAGSSHMRSFPKKSIPILKQNLLNHFQSVPIFGADHAFVQTKLKDIQHFFAESSFLYNKHLVLSFIPSQAYWEKTSSTWNGSEFNKI